MQKILYADLGRQTLSESLGGGNYSFPPLVEGDDITIGIRFCERRGDGRAVEVERTVSAIRVSLGLVDERPTAGTWKIKYGDAGDPSVENQNLTTALTYGATATEVGNALNALTDLIADYASGVTVELTNGSYLISGLDDDATLTGTVNRLTPASAIRVLPYQRADESWVHEIRLVQTPVAFTGTQEAVLPPAPSISEVSAGSTVDDVELPEKQKLKVPSTFRGLFGVRRTAEGLETGPLTFTGDPVEDAGILQAALNDSLLTDDEKEDSTEQFTVTASTTGALISFDGPSLVGIDQPLLVAYVVDAPPGDSTFTLAMDRPELSASLRDTGSATPEDEKKYQLQIEYELEDVHDSEIDRTVTVYRGEVTVVRDLAFDGQADGVAINWLHEHRDDYKPVSPDNIITGTHSASDAFGDGVATVFNIDHGLSSVNITACQVIENSEPGDALIPGTDFTWVVVNSGRIEITLLGTYASSPPSTDGLYYVIEAAGPAATYNAHDQEISTITGTEGDLQSILTSALARIAALEALAPSGSAQNVLQTTTAKICRWNFAKVFETYPWVDDPVTAPSSGKLAEVISQLKGTDYLALTLLNAQHVASVANLSTILSGTTLPAASGYDGDVFTHDGASEISLPASGGRGVSYLQPGEFVTSNGSTWYRVTPYARGAGVTFTAATATDLLTAADNQLIDGRRVQVSTTGTLPTGLSSATDYYVVNRDGDDFQLAATEGGDAIDITSTGSGTHTVTPQDETSYYPTDFERELFAFGVNNRQLVLKSSLTLNFGLELAVLPPQFRARQRSTRVHASLVIEVGRFPQATSPATTGLNLSDVTWDPNPVMEQRIVIGETPETHVLGYQVVRELASGVDTLSANAIYYGNAAATAAPYEFPFAVRGRIVRFDVEDDVSDPRGVLLISGLDRFEGAEAPVTPLGSAQVG